jgi:hypothetical protein
MRTVTALFSSPMQAYSACFRLRGAGFSRRQIVVLTPTSSLAKVYNTPTADGERPGMGRTMGALIGSAGGLWIGVLVGVLVNDDVAARDYVVILITALVASLTSLIGSVGGSALEDALSYGLPKDELCYYQAQTFKGLSVVLLRVDGATQVVAGRAVLENAGAISLNAARKDLWMSVKRARELAGRGRRRSNLGQWARHESYNHRSKRTGSIPTS